MKYRNLLLAVVMMCAGFAAEAAAAPRVDPELAARISVARPTDQLGVILTFYGNSVTDSQADSVRALGVRMGVRMTNFPIMAVNATPSQIQQMAAWSSLRSMYLNAPLRLNMHQTRPLIGVDRLRTDLAITARNGGTPVSGRGVTIAINDSGIDGSHQDLIYNPLNLLLSKTIQNVLVNPNDQDGLVVRLNSLGNPVEGILPPTYVENVINTDTHVGHGTHCAGIAAGTGQVSGGLYQGVAPGAKLVGLGSGGILFVLGQVAAFDYIYTHQFELNIRVVSNSWGNSAVAVDPEHPVNVASKKLAEERHIVVVFANGNDGPRPNSQNRWASVPWIITAGASMKDGRIASFSSRGIFGDPVIHPTVLTPGTGGPSGQGYTSAVIATRAHTNIVSTGLNDDAEIPTAFLPFYTQISGTSMACPHLAGVVANILEANPQLGPEQVRAIIEQTATPLSTYDQFEAGAGLANVHAAVDLAYNPQKRYGDFGFTGKGLTVEQQDGGTLEGSVAAQATDSKTFTIPANTRFTFVQLDWEGSMGEDEAVIDNTRIVMNDLALDVSGNGINQTSDALNLAALFGARECLKLEFPPAGTYTATVSSGSGFLQLTDQPYRITITHYTYDPSEVADISALDAAAQAGALRLVYDRVMSAERGVFRPADTLTRIELARALMLAARVPQYIPNQPSFIDIPANTPNALIAESLKREGVMGVSGTTFGPAVEVNRLEQAVALVRALRLDAQARALANSTVTAGGQPLVDNAQIPPAQRGYVQIAIDRGMMQAFPGPRFEPATKVKRADFIAPILKAISIMFGE